VLHWTPSWQKTSTAKRTDEIGSVGQSISGTVVDPSDAVVGYAPVTLTNVETGAALSTTTDARGYWLRKVEPGVYQVTIEAAGFTTLTQPDVEVASGEAHSQGRMMLQVGSVAQSVSVVGSRSMPIATPVPIVSGQWTPARGHQFAVVTRAKPLFCLMDCPDDGPVRVGGKVQVAQLVNATKPAYPAALQQAGVQGTVRIEATISKAGVPENIHVVDDADPGLIQAALDAVGRWRYQPAMLNSWPVEAMTTIDVNFSLEN
jgi:TonB family protein